MNQRRCFYPAPFPCVLLCALSLAIPTSSSAGSYSSSLSRRYSLSGFLELSYQRRWFQGEERRPSDQFRQLLLLDHSGYLADPRLFTYTISGRVSHDAGEGVESSTLLGGDIGLTLFRSLPKGVQKYSDYIPHPLWLRFSRESGNLADYTSYGLSLSHSVAKKKRFLELGEAPKPEGEAPKPEGEDADLYEDAPVKAAKIVEKAGIPFPTTYLDYDHYDQKSSGISDVRDILSLRSSLTGDYYDYRFLYENESQAGSRVLNRSVYQLQPNYRFYNEETKRRIEILNTIRREDSDLVQSTELGSSVNLYKPIGTDELSARGGIGYSDSSSALQTVASYNAAASGSYRKFFSPRLVNSTSLLAAFTKSENTDRTAGFTRNSAADNHTERLSDSVAADISWLYRGTATAYVGYGRQGGEFGGSATLSTKTRIATSIGYSYSLSSSQGTAGTSQAQLSSLIPRQSAVGRISKHDVTLSASGPLLYNLAFQTRADFTLSDVPVIGGISREETDTLSGNLLWRLPRTSVALGGNYSQMKKTNTETSTSTSSSLYATVTRILPMRMLFNFYTTWTKSSSTGDTKSESESIGIRPTLRWTRGLTSVDTEYSYSRSMGGGAPTVDQRFFARLVRKFSALF